jgi:hypothetical protein
MKLTPILVFICLTFSAFGQNFGDTNKYKISLPSFWKGSNTLLQKFDTTLAKHWSVLTNKKICTKSCKPYYLVTLEISEPKFGEQFISDYVNGGNYEKYNDNLPVSFNAKLILKNRKGEYIAAIPLVDSTKEYLITKPFTSMSKLSASGIREYVAPPNVGTDAEKRDEAQRRGSEQYAAMRSNNPESLEPPTVKKETDSQKQAKRKEDYLNDLYTIIDLELKKIK